MIDVSLDFNEFFTMCSCGIIAGLFMFTAFFIFSAIIRLFIVISYN